jgi:hypothetical protein
MEMDIQAGRVVTAATPREVSPPDSRRVLDAFDGQRFLAGFRPAGASTGSMFAIVTNWFEELRRRAPAKR